MSSAAPLFEPFKLKSLELPNRIVMAPMTRGFSPNGVPTKDVVDYYARRAAADVGLIISEGTLVPRKGASDNANYPLFHTEPALAGWKKVIDAVHGEGGKMAPQIWHQGLLRKSGTGHYPDAPSDSPSGVTHKGKQIFEEPSESEVADMVAAYAQAAASARELGFDTVEIHGAHGYLIDEFFWDVMNKREDKYGGTLVERATFAGEVISEVKKAVGPDIPVILRFSQWKQQDYDAKLARTPQEFEAFLKVFVDAGVDILHASQRRFWEAEFPEDDGENGLNTAGWAKKLTGLPTITVGSVGLSGEFIGGMRGEGSKTRPLTDVIDRLEKGEFDLVAVGRALLQDPFWAQKVKEGRTDELEGYDAKAMATLY
ncbi:NADH:flavin oxidoreductase [Henriciella pelagia]|uniref:NADH:flavin oxidoreductase n=1 Tax=Henriciella pelagia TaxID=1977912 RepID=UPI003516A102